MSQDMYIKFQNRYNDDLENITKQLKECKQNISNPDEIIKDPLHLSSKLSTVWRSSDVGNRRSYKSCSQVLMKKGQIIFR
jgi:hypothetical protein